MSHRYIISDNHFGHNRIILYGERSFKFVEGAKPEEMDKYMVKQWNSVVKNKNDIVYHLGDFVLYYKKEEAKKLVSSLRGRKILIMGNHDDKSRQWYLDVGFEQVCKFSIILDGFYMLSHKPMYVNKHMPYVNIHGHIHQNSYTGDQYVNACVECNDYKPFDFDKLKQKINAKEEEQEVEDGCNGTD